MESIVVTARRRRERLQDVPVSDTVFDSRFLAKSRVETPADLTQYTAGLDAFSSGPVTNFYIRGIGTADFSLASDADVPVFIDDIYIGRPGANTLALVDIASIEVLKGPQGTLVGRNSIGGAINITSRQPSDITSGRVDVTVGNFGERRVLGELNLPIVPGKLNAIFTGLYDQDDGVRRNDATGHRVDDQDVLGGRAAFAATLSDTLSATFTLDEQGNRAKTPAYRSDLPQFQPSAPGDVLNDSDPRLQQSNAGASLRVTWSPGGPFSYVGIAGWRRYVLKEQYDDDGTNLPVGSVLDHQLSQEGDFELRAVSVGSGPLKLVLGASAFVEGTDEAVGFLLGQPALDAVLQGAGLPTGIADPYSEFQFAKGQNESYAAYADASYDLMPSLTVSAGLRYTIDHKAVRTLALPSDYATALARLGEPGIPNLFVPASVGTPSSGQSFDGLTPRGAVTYKFAPDLSAYASITRGYKAGGFNSTQIAPDGTALLPAYEPEKVTSYEVGLKGDLFDKRLRVGLSGYHFDYTNLQVLLFQATSLVYRSVNASASGAELDLTAKPAPPLTLTASAGYEDSRIDQGIPGVAREGAPLSLAPRFSGSLVADYLQAVTDRLSVELRGEANFKSRQTSLVTDNDLTSQGFLPLFNARAALLQSSGGWELALWGRNLADRHYKANGANVSTLFGFPAYVPGAPRTFGVELTARF